METCPNVIAKRFKLKSLLGKGTFGAVYEAEDLESHKNCAVKLEPESTLHPQLLAEAKVLRNIQTMEGAPLLVWAGTEPGYNVIAMQLLGKNLAQLQQQCKGRFSVRTSFLVTQQMLQRVEALHNLHYLHRDIKPDNFALGREAKTMVYMLDFGLSKKYRDAATRQHIPYREVKGLIGTAKFASINSHQGMEQGRKDDLESLLYVLLNFLQGSLPWQSITASTPTEKNHRIADAKLAIDSELRRHGYQEILSLLQYVKGLRFEETPDYEVFQRTFRDVLIRENAAGGPAKFDWMEMQKKPSMMRRSSHRHRPVTPSKRLDAEGNTSSSSDASTKQAVSALPYFRVSTRVAIRRLTEQSTRQRSKEDSSCSVM